MERDFQKQVIDKARACGWMVQHTYGQGSVLGSKAIDRGFPDLVLLRGDRLVFAELKGSKGRVSDDQQDWITGLILAGVQAHVWYPQDWPAIEALLAAPVKIAQASA